MHPKYFSTELAEKLYGIAPKRIQHHHAHIASVMAEHSLEECLGFALDGTGLGDDGSIWGGEALLCRGGEYKRVAHFKTVTLSGGDEVAKNAGSALACYLFGTGTRPPQHAISATDAAIVSAAVQMRLNCFDYSGAGRLFDAVCALLDFGNYNHFEGECAIALENAAAEAISRGTVAYPLEMEYNNGVLDTVKLLCDISAAASRGVGAHSLALGFHIAVAEGLVKIAREQKVKKIALSGGTFNNRILTSYLKKRLTALGFEVYLNERVPCGDGGIALGQLYLAGKE
jgi:hydrogenase maturation protein HypF